MSTTKQGAAFGPPLLNTTRMTKLVDAACELFRVSYDMERMHKQVAKARLAAELASVDLLGLTVNQIATETEEYQPS